MWLYLADTLADFLACGWLCQTSAGVISDPAGHVCHHSPKLTPDLLQAGIYIMCDGVTGVVFGPKADVRSCPKGLEIILS